ncbi:hypothetical protein PybrP1_001792 [[Pythium] brassicae (nom. inval.)]|nr:hypothetical protein PybrP1_001792 [[Pythium] brassicae (nom. inval.)]
MSSRKKLSPDERTREREMLRELKKFHRENEHLAAPVATQFTKKRIRVPRIQPETNPFCTERQLADEYELLNLNKVPNPRFYTPSIKNSPRLEENPRNHSSFINQAADLMASSGFSPRARAEFAARVPPTAYQPGIFAPPEVVSIDGNDIRQIPSDADCTSPSVGHSPRFFSLSHEHYGCDRVSYLLLVRQVLIMRPTACRPPVTRSTQLSKLTVTFGHRPESAARMYDPLSSTIERPNVGKCARQQQQQASTPAKTGMSVMQLQELLTPAKATRTAGTETRSSSLTLSAPSSRSPRRVVPVQDRMRLIEREREQQETKQRALEELERGYTSAVFNPPRERKPVRFLPPTDHTTGQLIDKYRKLAVGKLPAPS